MAANKNDKSKGGKSFFIFSIILALAIAIGTWCYLIKTNKFFGLGELLRPRLKDIPIVCMILPEVTDPNADPNIMAREEINLKYANMLNENIELQKTVSELKLQVADRNELQNKYEILLKEVERQSIELTQYKEEEASGIKEKQASEERIKNLIKIYESMEPAEAANILEEIGELNISLVVDVCKAMKTSTFAEILPNMSTEFAAILSERMVD